jgi:hypothetical protein
MVRVIITRKLEEEISKIFKKQSSEILESFKSLEENPHKGKIVGQVNNIVIKELKNQSFRFYFITDGFKLKMLKKEELTDLLIKFVRLSNKRDQQKVIDNIKEILRKIGEDGF